MLTKSKENLWGNNASMMVRRGRASNPLHAVAPPYSCPGVHRTARPPLLTGCRNASNPCNSAGSSPVYILRLGALGRVPAGRLDRTCAPPGNQGAEERRRLQRGLQQACNLPATSLQPRRHFGATPVVLRLGPVRGEPRGDAENGQLCWTLPWQYSRYLCTLTGSRLSRPTSCYM